VKIGFDIGSSAGSRRWRLLLSPSAATKEIPNQVRNISALEARSTGAAKAWATWLGAARSKPLRHWPHTSRLVVLGALICIADYLVRG
jgi:hypothetical protein